MIRPRPAAEHDVKRPACPSTQSEEHTDGIDSLTGVNDRQNESETGEGEPDAEEIDWAMRGEGRDRERACELQSDGNSERDSAQREVEAQVHHPDRHAVERQRLPVRLADACPPGAQRRYEDEGPKADPKGHGSDGPYDREQRLGDGGAGLNRHHGQ